MMRDPFSKKSFRPVIDIIAAGKKQKPVILTEIETAEEKKAGETKRRPKQKTNKRRFILPLIFLFIFGAGATYLGWWVLPQLTVNLELKRYAVDFNEAVETGKNFTLQQNPANNSIIKLPAEFFKENRNLQSSFPATGKQKIETKALGKLLIYNNYSSEPQSLVAKTRLETPDHKIFRLDKAIIVPGAKIEEGKIIPSSIEVAVTADQPGPEYNVGPIEKFTIPGFQGSSKFAGFYGKSEQAMTNGFIGEAAVPTEKDIEQARNKMRENLTASLKTILLANLPPELKILDNAFDFTVVNEKIIQPTAPENNFSIFSEAQGKLLTFRENDLKEILTAKSLKQTVENCGDCKLFSLTMEYGALRPDFQNGEMSFLAKGKAEFTQKIDLNSLRKQFSGKNESEIKTIIYSLPGVEKAQIFFWPFYVKKTPDKIEKIKISLQ